MLLYSTKMQNMKALWYKNIFKGVIFLHKVKFSIFQNQSYVDLGLYQFGMEACEAGHSFGPAKRNHYLFHYIISGTGILLSDNSNGKTETWHIKAGEGFFIFPEQTNTYIADMKDPWEYIWLEFDGLRVKQAFELAGFSRDMPLYKTKSEELREKMRNEMIFIVENDKAGTFELIGHLYLFMEYLTRSAENGKIVVSSKLRDFYIREAITFIENNYEKDIKIEDISEVLKLNRSYFGKIFKIATGKSPQSFLINYRMTKAAELLTLTKLSVNEIGMLVGYQNQMHFSRAFKMIYKIPPREWRNKIHIIDD